MSDDQQGGVPDESASPEETPTPDTNPEAGSGTGPETSPEADAQAEPGADAGAPETDSEADTDDADDAGADAEIPEEALTPDAAAALAAAQAAVADAMSGDLTGADDASVDAAQSAADETNQDIEAMMAQAMAEEGIDASAQGGPQPTGFAMPTFKPAGPAADSAEMQLLGDVNVDVRIELGRTRMLVEDVLRLGEGAVVELEKLAGDPVDVYVNGRHVAKGEVLVLNESFCVRVNEVLEPVTVEAAEDS